MKERGTEGNLRGIITGAAGSIGRATAAKLSGRGASLLLNDTDSAGLAAVTASIREAGGQVISDSADVTVKEQVMEMVRRGMETFGRLDFIVCIVGGARNSSFLDISEEEWEWVMGINLKSAFLCAQAIAPHMIARKSGRIVTISSFAKDGVRWFAPIGHSRVHYSAAKAGVAAFTRALSIELGPYGITANCVVPGPIRLPRSKSLWDRVESDPAVKIRPADLITLQRYCEPEDVAGSVAFCLSEDAAYVTGAELYVTGGM